MPVSEEPLEIYGRPVHAPGQKVRAVVVVRDDGSTPGVSVGTVLVRPGDVGYVRDVGTFLQRYYIYAVDFIGSGRVVGMRAAEIEPFTPQQAHSAPLSPPPLEDRPS